MSIDVCVPFGYREDLLIPMNKAMTAWLKQGVAPFIGEAWTDGFFHQTRARNLAAEQGHARYILFADADMIPEPGALTLAIALIASRPDKDCCFNLWNWKVPDLAWPDRTEISEPISQDLLDWMRAHDADPAEWERVWDMSRIWGHNDLYGPFLVARSVYDAVGGQCEQFVSWGAEDDDFFATLKRYGVPLVPCSEPRFIQAPHRSTRCVEIGNGANYAKNQALFYERLNRR